MCIFLSLCRAMVAAEVVARAAVAATATGVLSLLLWADAEVAGVVAAAGTVRS